MLQELTLVDLIAVSPVAWSAAIDSLIHRPSVGQIAQLIGAYVLRLIFYWFSFPVSHFVVIQTAEDESHCTKFDGRPICFDIAARRCVYWRLQALFHQHSQPRQHGVISDSSDADVSTFYSALLVSTACIFLPNTRLSYHWAAYA